MPPGGTTFRAHLLPFFPGRKTLPGGQFPALPSLDSASLGRGRLSISRLPSRFPRDLCKSRGGGDICLTAKSPILRVPGCKSTGWLWGERGAHFRPTTIQDASNLSLRASYAIFSMVEDFWRKIFLKNSKRIGITGIGRLMEKELVNWKELKSCWIISKGLRNWKIVWLRPQLVRFSQRKIRIFPVTILSGSAKHSHGVSRSHERAFTRYRNSPYKDKPFFLSSLSFSTPINLVLAAPDRHAPLRLITKRGENTKWNPRIKISFSSLSWFKKWTNIYIYNRS